MTTPTALSRLRGATVGGASAITGVGAHAAAQGTLSGTPTLLMVAATAVALGLGITAAPTLGVLPALVGGQALIHVLLVLTSGHHHDMFTAPMAAMHAVGTVAALLLLCGAELLVRAASALSLRAVRLRFRPLTPAAVLVPRADAMIVPTALRFLGAVGRRGPPFD
ncbi:hypothetical protein [Gordonia sp. (in: high G+C Gram-positive bacteria)]|uniref:hypothetical protein n=1 Tax=Gordonia sp. (in: high G+C Gram-positive bacteria) TaxID=84139 RepID=UPI0016BA1854|nr:hypothetical protein [Gordonia sp. (in: high G+C Gram-positive bacteria)]NLG47321.1 hypothetical protein [Gordonia sp. (in: high G+C Gram-positive bacteria)]